MYIFRQKTCHKKKKILRYKAKNVTLCNATETFRIECNNQFLRQIIESMADGVFALDTTGRITKISYRILILQLLKVEPLLLWHTISGMYSPSGRLEPWQTAL